MNEAPGEQVIYNNFSWQPNKKMQQLKMEVYQHCLHYFTHNSGKKKKNVIKSYIQKVNL